MFPDGSLLVGFDPGLNITGYGVVEVRSGRIHMKEAGVVRGGSNRSLEARLVEIHNGVGEILDSYKPLAVAVEQLYSHYERPRTAILMGHARGVICLAAALRQIPMRHFPATNVKKMLTGNGRAPKSQMQMAVCREFQLAKPPEPPDVADALAIAMCCFHAGRHDDWPEIDDD